MQVPFHGVVEFVSTCAKGGSRYFLRYILQHKVPQTGHDDPHGQQQWRSRCEEGNYSHVNWSSLMELSEERQNCWRNLSNAI